MKCDFTLGYGRISDKWGFVVKRDTDFERKPCDPLRKFGTPIKCVTTGKVYHSITKCAKEMNLNNRNLAQKSHDANGQIFNVKNYLFVLVES